MDETAPDEAADIEYEHSMELNISICSKFFKVAQTSDLPTDNVTFRILQQRFTKQTIFHMNYCTACNDEGDKYFSCGHGKDTRCSIHYYNDHVRVQSTSMVSMVKAPRFCHSPSLVKSMTFNPSDIFIRLLGCSCSSQK
jgi:hypothetical protein